MTSAPEIEAVIRLRRDRGLRTIFEISDNTAAPGSWLARGHRLRSPLVQQNILFHASQCDLLQLYTPSLAELYGSVNPAVAVVDPYVPIADDVTRADGFVFGWGGSATHREDLLTIAPVVERFCARHRDAVFAFMGHRALFDELFAGIPSGQTRHRPFGPFDEYLAFVRTLHVGLVPLGPTPFNATRTDTKFVTLAAAGAAALLQDAPPYRPHTGRARLFSTPEDLDRQLEALYADRGALRELAGRAHAWVRESHGRDALRAQRERIYRPLLPAVDADVTAPPPAAPDLVARLTDAGAGTPDDTIAVCRALLVERPGYPQAQWTLMRTLETAGRRDEACAFAASIVPHPVYADLVAELQARHDGRHAARLVSPLRRLRLQAKRAHDPLAFYREVLRHQPYDFFALQTVIRLVSRQTPEAPELDELYARAALVSPDLVPADRRPAHLAGLLPA
jgi:hypothetical protein